MLRLLILVVCLILCKITYSHGGKFCFLVFFSFEKLKNKIVKEERTIVKEERTK